MAEKSFKVGEQAAKQIPTDRDTFGCLILPGSARELAKSIHDSKRRPLQRYNRLAQRTILRRSNPMHLWQEIQALSSSTEFKKLFAKMQGLDATDRTWIAEMLERLEAFLPKPRQ